MVALRLQNYERQVLAALCSDALPNSTLFAALNHPRSISLKFDGASYFLELEHPELPEARIVCDKPEIAGTFQEREIGFVAFLEGRSLTLECYAKDSRGIPESIRYGVVSVSAT